MSILNCYSKDTVYSVHPLLPPRPPPLILSACLEEDQSPWRTTWVLNDDCSNTRYEKLKTSQFDVLDCSLVIGIP
jgi:hypothetical protein